MVFAMTTQRTTPLECTEVLELKPTLRVQRNDIDIKIYKVGIVDAVSLCGADSMWIMAG